MILLPEEQAEKKSTMEVTTFVAIGQHYWGSGSTEAEAKQVFRRQSSAVRLGYGYTVIEFPPGIEFEGVDQMGSVHWRWPEDVADEDRVQPVVTEHAPKGSA